MAEKTARERLDEATEALRKAEADHADATRALDKARRDHDEATLDVEQENGDPRTRANAERRRLLAQAKFDREEQAKREAEEAAAREKAEAAEPEAADYAPEHQAGGQAKTEDPEHGQDAVRNEGDRQPTEPDDTAPAGDASADEATAGDEAEDLSELTNKELRERIEKIDPDTPTSGKNKDELVDILTGLQAKDAE